MFLLQSPLVRGPLGHPAVASSLSDHGGVLPMASSPLRYAGSSSLASFLQPLRLKRRKRLPRPPRSHAATLLCGALAAAGSEASEGPAPGHQGAARAPHSPARSGLRESYRGELRGTRTQTRVTPRASASAPRPTAPARTASRSPQQPPPLSPLHKMADSPLSGSAFQKGRDGMETSRGGAAQAR